MTDIARERASRLTDLERSRMARARELAGLTAPNAVQEYTGDSDPLMAYAVAFGRAQHHLDDLLAIVARLTGDGDLPDEEE